MNRVRVNYWDDEAEPGPKRRTGEVLEVNGNLTLVRDDVTGEERYLAPFEVEDRIYE